MTEENAFQYAIDHAGQALEAADAPSDLARYFESFTGAYFETSGRRASDGWADADPNHFTIEDVQSPALLSVPLRPQTMVDVLALNDGELPRHLAAIPTALDLADAPRATKPWQEWWDDASEVYRLVRGIADIGRTTASKLLARKRPRLLPVWDSLVSAALGTERIDNDWEVMQAVVIAHRRRLDFLIDELKRSTPGDSRLTAISALRVLDIVVWMSAKNPQ